MSQFPDLDVLKEIPGYQAILKAVLKSQIQLLVEQLATQTGEESVILTASISDGTLCHLGSDSGKVFLDDHDEFKSQFLGFCLKRHHKRKAEEDANQRSSFDPGSSGMSKRVRNTDPYPIPSASSPMGMQKVGPARNVAGQRRAPSHTETHPSHSQVAPGFSQHQFPYADNSSSNLSIKQESDLGAGDSSAQQIVHSGEDSSSGNPPVDSSETGEGPSVKAEPSEEELEITGVEMSNMSESSQSGYDQSQWSGQGYGGAEGTSFEGDDQAFANNLMMKTYMEQQQEQEKEASRGKKKEAQNREPLDCKFVIGPDGKIGFQCNVCMKLLSSRKNLERHYMIHTGEKPFNCEVCGKSYNQKAVLKRHIQLCHMKKWDPSYIDTGPEFDQSSLDQSSLDQSSFDQSSFDQSSTSDPSVSVLQQRFLAEGGPDEAHKDSHRGETL